MKNSEAIRASMDNLPPTGEIAGDAKNHAYGQILRSSAWIGASSVLSMAIGLVRTKVMAVLLGPGGVGLLGLYTSIMDLAQSIASMGINSSGVRQIAEAVGSGDAERIARTAKVLRQTSILLGVLAVVLLVAFSKQVSGITFGTNEHGAAVALLSVAVFFRLLSDAQGALIQGMRRIADLAKMSILSALFGTLISIPMVYFLREKGLVPYLVALAAVTLATSWWFRRKINVHAVSITRFQARQEQARLLKLGLAFMASGVMVMGTAYIIRILVLRTVGFDAAGLYQCAWTLGGLYIGLILQAMGADFYPRLTAIAEDHPECNRLVNEQTQISVLLAAPGVIATLTFAPVVIALIYSIKFEGAVTVLRWICLGGALRVISWPMGYIILAKGKQNLFFWSELAWTIVHVVLAWTCVNSFGLNGAGIAFFGSYVFHCFLIYPMVRRLTGFRWSKVNRQAGFIFLTLIAIVFCSSYLLSKWWAVGLGTCAMFLSGIYSIRVLLTLVSLDRIPRPLLRLLEWSRLSSARLKS